MTPDHLLPPSRATLIALLCAATFVGCSESPTQFGAPTRMPNGASLAEVTSVTLDSPNSASAQLGSFTDKVNLQIPTQFHAQNPCAGGRFGEIVVFTGDQHLVFSQTSTANGHLSTMIHWNADDVIGVGQYTGYSYRATGVTQDHVVSNAVLHSSGPKSAPITLTAAVSADLVRITVTDAGDGFVPKQRDPTSIHDGYGLYLVDKSASRWGVDTTAPTSVWFELSRAG